MRKVLLILFILFSGCLSKIDLAYSAENRGVAVQPERANQAMEGEYWAFIIGIDDYQGFPKLDTAVNDAKAVKEILVKRYGFKDKNIKQLYDRDATRENIENIFFELTSLVKEKDSLFIYYG